GLRFSASGDALDWLYAEAGCLLACARQSSDAPRLSRAVDLLWVTRDLSESGSHAAPYESTAILLLDAAESSGDPRTVGRAALVLAESELFLSRFDAAERMAAQALREAETSGDTAVLCRAAALRGLVDFSRGRYGAAEARLDRALEGYRADGDRPG
ncbi:AfsR family transcriptional regulator, partial [Streptomyces sp. SID2955]|nr:AfsR family transcriptional regulator [Streptomyces sp. SID2955]